MKMFSRASRVAAVTALLVLMGTACKSKTGGTSGAATSASASASSELIDLSTSLDALRTAFNAHKQEARFLTLLSPA
jgi:hypothetical protein